LLQQRAGGGFIYGAISRQRPDDNSCCTQVMANLDIALHHLHMFEQQQPQLYLVSQELDQWHAISQRLSSWTPGTSMGLELHPTCNSWSV
jgi:hypothetical protein